MKAIVKRWVYGMVFTIGLVCVTCCDAETPGRLFAIVLFGIGLMLLGGQGVVANSQNE